MNITYTTALCENPYHEKIEAHVMDCLHNEYNGNNYMIAKEIGVVAETIELPIEVELVANTTSYQNRNETRINADNEREMYIEDHSTWFMIRTCTSVLFIVIIIVVYLVGKSNNG
jgi:hypothetical protein